ncbi:MAG: ComEC/Rec2 family competence protein, partial [Planctomycetota bacterium]
MLASEEMPMDRPAANPVGPALLIRMPMALVAAAMAAGIVCGRFGTFSAGTYSLLAAAGVLAAATSFFRKHLAALTTAGLVLAIASLAATYALWRTQSVSGEHIVRRTSRAATLATVRGRVVTSPVHVAEDPDALSWPRPPRTVFVLRAEAIAADDDWLPASGLVRVTVNETDDRLHAGQRVDLAGWLGRFGSAGSPGQFDYAQWAATGGLHARLSVPSPGAVTIFADQSQSWVGRVLWRLRASARQHLLASGDEREGKLLNALILGERDPSLRTLSEAMVRAGIAHFLSISGLHLGIFLGFVFLLCRLAMLSPRRSAAVVLGVLIGYVLLAEPRPPLLRSAIMAGSLCIAAIVRRRAMPFNALAVAAVILLIASPMNLFDAGFQLSFTIVGGVLVLHRPVRGLLFGRWIRRRGLMVFRREQSVRRWLTYQFADWAMAGVVIALSAYIAAAPLVAYHFGLFTPWAPLLSVLLLPVIVAILVPGYISLMLAWPMPNLAHAVGRLSAAAADWLARAVVWFDGLPGMHVELRPVGVWAVVLAYGVIVLALLRRRVRYGRLALAVGLVMVVGAAVWTQRTAPPPNVAELHLLDVGAGQCALLRAPGGRTVLIDAGSQSRLELAER